MRLEKKNSCESKSRRTALCVQNKGENMKKEKNIKALLVYSGCDPFVETIPNELKEFQDIVDGYIEVVRMSNTTMLICNEEGKIKDFEANRCIIDENGNMVDVICGTFILVGDDGDDFKSLSDDDVEYWTHYFTEKAPILW